MVSKLTRNWNIGVEETVLDCIQTVSNDTRRCIQRYDSQRYSMIEPPPIEKRKIMLLRIFSETQTIIK